MSRTRSSAGFTLPEVLVVTLVIAILATIALPAFARQADRGHDAAARSDAASLASLMEHCNVETEDFHRCDTESELSGDAGVGVGLPLGTGTGQVEIAQAGPNTYRIVARSRSGASYRIMRNGSGARQRTCNPRGHGGCPTGGNW